MGQEIVYCYKCQRRVVGADFTKGQAYQVGNHVSCASCAADLLPKLGAHDRERLLAQMFKATQARGEKSSPHVPVDRPPPPVAHVVPAVPTRQPPPVIWVLLAGVLVAILAAALMMSGGNKPEPAGSGGPARPRESAEDARAQAALRSAREVARTRPDDLDGQIKAWQDAVRASDQTSCLEEAKRELDGRVVRRRELIAKALGELEAQARPKLDAEEFKAASLLYESARPRFSAPEWTGPIDAKVKEIYDRAVTAATSLRVKAVAAQERRAPAEAKMLVDRVARWGYPEVELEFRRAVEAAAPAAPAGPPGLVAQWPLGEGKGTGAVDASGRWRAELKGSAGWVQAGSGSALRLDGNGAHLELPSTPELDRLQSGSYTISIWFKPESLPTEKNDQNLGSAWAIVMKAPHREGLLYFTGGKFIIVHWLAGVKWTSAGSWVDSFPPGSWYHLVGVVDCPAGQSRMYVNGVLKGKEDWPKNSPAQDFGAERWAIGKVRYYNKDTYFAKGAFRDLRFYDRALDATEVASLYAAGSPAGK